VFLPTPQWWQEWTANLLQQNLSYEELDEEWTTQGAQDGCAKARSTLVNTRSELNEEADAVGRGHLDYHSRASLFEWGDL
jgi:hypothetical protein